MSDQPNGTDDARTTDDPEKGFTTYGFELEKAYERFLNDEEGAQEEFVRIFKAKHAETRRRLGLE